MSQHTTVLLPRRGPAADHAFALRRLLRQRMRHCRVDYTELARRYAARWPGLPAPTPTALKNRINRGRFSATFMVQVLIVLEVEGLVMAAD